MANNYSLASQSRAEQMPPQPMALSEVDRSLDSGMESAVELRNLVEELANKLSPVLNRMHGGDEKGISAPDVVLSPVASRIEGIAKVNACTVATTRDLIRSLAI